MQLKLLQPYKSLTYLPPLDLPSFSILTGLNGSGKTHLLEAIKLGKVEVVGIPVEVHSPQIAYFDWNSLVPKDVNPTDPHDLIEKRNGLWKRMRPAIDKQLEGIQKRILQAGVATSTSANLIELILASPTELARLIPDELVRNQVTAIFFERLKRAEEAIITAAGSTGDTAARRTLKRLSDDVGLPLIAIQSDTFHESVKLGRSEASAFQQSFGTLFTGYHFAFCQNQVAQFRVHKGDTSISCFTDEEFLKINGPPPWEVVNEILEKSGLHFRVSHPVGHGDQVFQPMLAHIRTKVPIRFEDLSSGEKILMSLALCLYHASDSREYARFPRLLLFDEIDAPLHPSMTTSLLRTINETLVGKLKIGVILATHSPSTVALAEEDALYLVTADGERISKMTKDGALAALTEGVPTLSVNFDNRRQVFVEGRYDVDYFESICQAIRTILHPEVSLNFISSGESDGNCDRVTTLVNQLASNGNRTVFGIVDWDAKHASTERVRVLGEGVRYSIENYIFDPLILASFLRNERLLTRDQIGLGPDENHTHIVELDEKRLQYVADAVVALIAPHCPQPAETELIDCHYCNGKTIKLPTWYLRMRGHDLEASIKEAFPEVAKFISKGQATLKKRILATIVDDCPMLLSKDFCTLMLSIQNAS